MSTKLVFSTLVGAATNFLLGFLLHAVIFADFFAPVECVTKIPMQMWAIIISSLTLALNLYLIIHNISRLKSLLGGFCGGAIIGFLTTLTVDLNMYSMYTLMDMKSLIIDVILSTFSNAIMGGIIGLIYRSGK